MVGDMGSGGVRCTNGVFCCFLGFLRMKGLVNRALVANGRKYRGLSYKTRVFKSKVSFHGVCNTKDERVGGKG